MKAMIIEKYGHTPLKQVDIPKPKLRKGDILVEIHAASINPVDFKIRNGTMRMIEKYKMPIVLGNDFAGVVKEVGKKTYKFKVGDAVYGRASKQRPGTFAEYIAINENDLALKPESLTFEQAASIPLVGLTSYQALNEHMHLTAGQKVLIHAGSGGVGSFAIQLAKAMGLYVATTASQAGKELVASLGADKIIDYKNEKFENVIQDYHGVYDTLGGKTLKRSFGVLQEKGDVVSIAGLPNGRYGLANDVGLIKTNLFRIATLPLRRLEKKYKVKYTFFIMKPDGEQLTYITQLIEAGKIKPVIDQVFQFKEAQRALDYVETGRAKGKVVLSIK